MYNRLNTHAISDVELQCVLQLDNIDLDMTLPLEPVGNPLRLERETLDQIKTETRQEYIGLRIKGGMRL